MDLINSPAKLASQKRVAENDEFNELLAANRALCRSKRSEKASRSTKPSSWSDVPNESPKDEEEEEEELESQVGNNEIYAEHLLQPRGDEHYPSVRRRIAGSRIWPVPIDRRSNDGFLLSRSYCCPPARRVVVSFGDAAGGRDSRDGRCQ